MVCCGVLSTRFDLNSYIRDVRRPLCPAYNCPNFMSSLTRLSQEHYTVIIFFFFGSTNGLFFPSVLRYYNKLAFSYTFKLYFEVMKPLLLAAFRKSPALVKVDLLQV